MVGGMEKFNISNRYKCSSFWMCVRVCHVFFCFYGVDTSECFTQLLMKRF